MNIAVLFLLLFYLFIGALHALLTGISVFALLGKRSSTWPKFGILLLLIAVQAALETYWIGIVSQLGFSLHTSNSNILHLFGASASDNLVDFLRPGWLSPLLWILWGCLAYGIGKKTMSRFRFIN